MSEGLSHAENDVNELLQTKEFGAPLKKAREKLNLSASEVAESLLINVDIINAIDNSQAQDLPSLTFTQGYLRNYARLVDIPVDDILNDYMQMSPDSKQPFTPHSVIPVQKTSNDALLKSISLSFILLFFVALIFWMLNTDFKMDDAPGNQAQAVSSQVDELSTESELASKISQQKKLTSSVSYISGETYKTTDEVIQPVKVEQQPNDTQPELTEQKDVISTDKKVDQLLLSALGPSWCEVKDATGKRLYYNMLKSGDEITLSGVAPFTLSLGNAPKVRVEINNTIVDFESLININTHTAKLEINQNASVVRLLNR